MLLNIGFSHLSKLNKKSTVVKDGSNSLLLGTSFHVIATAPGSEGEHGVHLCDALLSVRLK